MHDLERRVIGKVMRRLIPFLILCYFVAYLDRVNVSFAKLHMNQALGFSEAAFGLGAGLFFIAYFLFEVPSNIFLERVGARLWIALCVPKSKSERIDDEVRPVWRANL
jgi:MFS transporter, ACS family, tartrate transporter